MLTSFSSKGTPVVQPFYFRMDCIPSWTSQPCDCIFQGSWNICYNCFSVLPPQADKNPYFSWVAPISTVGHGLGTCLLSITYECYMHTDID